MPVIFLIKDSQFGDKINAGFTEEVIGLEYMLILSISLFSNYSYLSFIPTNFFFNTGYLALSSTILFPIAAAYPLSQIS